MHESPGNSRVSLPSHEAFEALEAKVAELEARLQRPLLDFPFMSRPQAALYLGVSRSWLEKQKDVPGQRRIPGTTRIVYDRRVLDRWLETV